MPPKQRFSETVFIIGSPCGSGSGLLQARHRDNPDMRLSQPPVTQAIATETVRMLTAVEIRIAAETRCGATP